MTATNQFAAHVGLDWADKKHDVCVQFKNGERVFHVIEHTAEALDVWLTELHQKVKGRIAIALELKKGPVVYALQKYPFITVFPVHALSLARYRQAFSPSGAKDDPQDAELALELMLRYPQKIKAIPHYTASSRMNWMVMHYAASLFTLLTGCPTNVIATILAGTKPLRYSHGSGNKPS